MTCMVKKWIKGMNKMKYVVKNNIYQFFNKKNNFIEQALNISLWH